MIYRAKPEPRLDLQQSTSGIENLCLSLHRFGGSGGSNIAALRSSGGDTMWGRPPGANARFNSGGGRHFEEIASRGK